MAPVGLGARLARAGLVALLLAACSASPPPPSTPAQTPTATSPPSTPAAAQPAQTAQTAQTDQPGQSGQTAAAAETAGELAQRGQSVFATVCAACHGQSGQGLLGPALIGPRASFNRFGQTARGYYTYIRSNMPQNAPGSLTPQEYLSVTAYLLVQNGLVDSGAAFGEDSLDSISLRR